MSIIFFLNIRKLDMIFQDIPSFQKSTWVLQMAKKGETEKNRAK